MNFAVDVLALESVAEHLTAVRPIGKRLPDRGTQLALRWPSTASLDAGAGEIEGRCQTCRTAARIRVTDDARQWAGETLDAMTPGDRSLVLYPLERGGPQ